MLYLSNNQYIYYLIELVFKQIIKLLYDYGYNLNFHTELSTTNKPRYLHNKIKRIDKAIERINFINYLSLA